MTALASLSAIILAINPIAAAVFLLQGSAKRWSGENSRESNWRRVSSACWWWVPTYIFSIGTRGNRRCIVFWIMVPEPTNFCSCFGLCSRLTGQNRVPLPPAKITPYIIFGLSLFFCQSWVELKTKERFSGKLMSSIL